MALQGLTILFMSALLAGAPKEDDKKKETDDLQGAWKSGVAVVNNEQTWTTLEINGNALVWTNSAKEKSIVKRGILNYTFKLGLDQKPRTIDLTRAEEAFANRANIQLGVYRLEGNKLALCVSQIGKERPKGLEVQEGSEQKLILLERIKP